MGQSYSEMQKVLREKFKDATIAQCDFAIRDIDETLKLHRDKDTSHPYIAKLFCERDEAIDRKYKLNKIPAR